MLYPYVISYWFLWLPLFDLFLGTHTCQNIAMAIFESSICLLIVEFGLTAVLISEHLYGQLNFSKATVTLTPNILISSAII